MLALCDLAKGEVVVEKGRRATTLAFTGEGAAAVAALTLGAEAWRAKVRGARWKRDAVVRVEMAMRV